MAAQRVPSTKTRTRFPEPRVTRPDWYRGKIAVLTTKHGKERVISRPLRVALGLAVRIAEMDTDLLGTFTGEIERIGTPSEVATRKARLGMKATAESLGLASEGSFGPHPLIPWLPSNHELLVFVDDGLGIEVVESVITEHTNYNHTSVQRAEELDPFLKRVRFPSHAVIARPNEGLKPGLVFKGITDIDTLQAAVERCADASSDGRVHIETDMRAHMNPMRRRTIRQVAFRLARRLACSCPTCGAPGWGQVGAERGLPCEECGTATSLIQHEVFGCARCSHRTLRPRSDGRLSAEPGECPYCNP